MDDSFRDYTDFTPTIFHSTPEGYLTGEIRVTGAGVFSYMTDHGLKRRLRPITQVGAQDSIATLNSKPITLLHPSEDVTPENVSRLSVGFTGNDARWDGLNAYVTMTVTDPKAIKDMREGKVRAVSCGYSAGLVDGEGNWQGVYYDETMTNIRYNHIALVKEGRAGDGVRFRIGDSAEFERIFDTKNAPNGAGDKRMRKLIIDGVEFEADEKVIDSMQATEKARNAALADCKNLKAQLDTITAARDAAVAERDQLKASIKDEAEIARLVDEKVALIDSAKKFAVEIKAGDSSETIRAAIVKKAYPTIALDGKSAEYMAGMFDAAMQKLGDDGSKKSPLTPDMSKVKDGEDSIEDGFNKMNEKLAKVSIKKEA